MATTFDPSHEHDRYNQDDSGALLKVLQCAPESEEVIMPPYVYPATINDPSEDIAHPDTCPALIPVMAKESAEYAEHTPGQPLRHTPLPLYTNEQVVWESTSLLPANVWLAVGSLLYTVTRDPTGRLVALGV